MADIQTADHPKRRWWVWLLVGLAFLLVAGSATLAGGLWWLSQQDDVLGTTKIDELTRTQAEQTAGVAFPASTSRLHTHYAAFQDYIVHVRFEIDPSDAEAFVRSLPISEPTISTVERPMMYTEGMPEWWKPESAGKFQAISGVAKTAAGYPDSQTVLIDTTDPSRYIVYIVAFDT
jgi:hypothetical protein